MKIKDRQQFDNLIITMIKLYPTNLTYAFNRVSEISGAKYLTVQNRWYKHLRHREAVYTIVTDSVIIRNTRIMRSSMIDKLMNIFKL